MSATELRSVIPACAGSVSVHAVAAKAAAMFQSSVDLIHRLQTRRRIEVCGLILP